MASPKPPEFQQFPCPNCGANLQFNPGAGQLKCPYCGCEEVTKATTETVVERPLEQFLNAEGTVLDLLSATAQEVDCPGCGAKVTFEPPDVAGDCPFCGTGIVAQFQGSNPVLTPEAILPFGLDKKAAQTNLDQWLGNLWFAPNGLKRMAQYEKMQGVYLPFWTYDCHTVSDYQGQRGEHYYETKVVDGEEKQVKKTRWHHTSGQVRQGFDDVLIPATTSLNQQHLEQLEPWPLSELVSYNPAYLAGFKAQHYQIPLQEGFEQAKKKMAPQIRSRIRRDMGGDDQRIDSVEIQYHDRTFKHLLLPVWLCAYRFQNKPFQVMINAQTGEVLGDRPYSFLKILLTVFMVALLTVGGFWLLIQEQGTDQLLQHPEINQSSQINPPSDIIPFPGSSQPSEASLPISNQPQVNSIPETNERLISDDL